MDVRHCESCQKITPFKGTKCLSCGTRRKARYPLGRLLILVVAVTLGVLVVVGPSALEASKNRRVVLDSIRDSEARQNAQDEPVAETPGLGCLEFIKPYLLDPAGAYLVRERVVAGRVYIEYRSRNRMGGYIPGEESCPMAGETITHKDKGAWLIEFMERNDL